MHLYFKSTHSWQPHMKSYQTDSCSHKKTRSCLKIWPLVAIGILISFRTVLPMVPVLCTGQTRIRNTFVVQDTNDTIMLVASPPWLPNGVSYPDTWDPCGTQIFMGTTNWTWHQNYWQRLTAVTLHTKAYRYATMILALSEMLTRSLYTVHSA